MFEMQMMNAKNIEEVFQNIHLDQFVLNMDPRRDIQTAMNCISIIYVFAISPYTLFDVLSKFERVAPYVKKFLLFEGVSINKKIDGVLLVDLLILAPDYRVKVLALGFDGIFLDFLKRRRRPDSEQVEEVVLINIIQFFIYLLKELYILNYRINDQHFDSDAVPLLSYSIDEKELVREAVMLLEEILLSEFPFIPLTDKILVLLEHCCYLESNRELMVQMKLPKMISSSISKMIDVPSGELVIQKAIWLMNHFGHVDEAWPEMINKDNLVQILSILNSEDLTRKKLGFGLLWDFSYCPETARIVADLPANEYMRPFLETYLAERETYKTIVINLCQEPNFQAKFKSLIPHKIVFLSQNLNPDVFDTIIGDISTSNSPSFFPLSIDVPFEIEIELEPIDMMEFRRKCYMHKEILNLNFPSDYRQKDPLYKLLDFASREPVKARELSELKPKSFADEISTKVNRGIGNLAQDKNLTDVPESILDQFNYHSMDQKGVYEQVVDDLLPEDSRSQAGDQEEQEQKKMEKLKTMVEGVGGTMEKLKTIIEGLASAVDKNAPNPVTGEFAEARTKNFEQSKDFYFNNMPDPGEISLSTTNNLAFRQTFKTMDPGGGVKLPAIEAQKLPMIQDEEGNYIIGENENEAEVPMGDRENPAMKGLAERLKEVISEIKLDAETRKKVKYEDKEEKVKLKNEFYSQNEMYSLIQKRNLANIEVQEAEARLNEQESMAFKKNYMDYINQGKVAEIMISYQRSKSNIDDLTNKRLMIAQKNAQKKLEEAAKKAEEEIKKMNLETEEKEDEITNKKGKKNVSFGEKEKK